MAHEELIKWRRRQYLIFFGYSDADIVRLGDLSKLTNERMNELIHSDKLETTEKTCHEPNIAAPNVSVLEPYPKDRHFEP